MDKIKIGLLGNPNSGKSSLFNQLTGLRQHVANFPGVTVDKKVGKTSLNENVQAEVIDLPGTYSLFPNTSDEKIVIQILSDIHGNDYPDLIVYVADITNLERHMLMATQIADLGIPMILCLNMVDLVEDKVDSIHIDVLKEFLTIPILPLSGKTGKNISELKKYLFQFASGERRRFLNDRPVYEMRIDENQLAMQIKEITGNANPYFNKIIAHHSYWLSHLSAIQKENIANIVSKNSFEDIPRQVEETLKRFEILTPVVRRALGNIPLSDSTITSRIDNVNTHRVYGPLIFFLIMFFVFQAIFSWAEYPMTWIEEGFIALGALVREVLPLGWFTDLLTEGVIAGLGGIMVFIPQITILFLIIAALEETGYMSRAVFLFDGIMQRFGLNGRSVVALISSGACAIPAIMSTRTIADRKERLITIMVSPLISCSARIPVYAVLIGFVVPPGYAWGIFNIQGLAFMGLYLLGIMAALVSAIVFKWIIKSRDHSYLMMELPLYKPPVLKNVALVVKEKVTTFVVEAGKIILIISVLLWFLSSYGPTHSMLEASQNAMAKAEMENLDEDTRDNLIAATKIEASYAGIMGKWIEPVIKPLGFDWKIGIALITSFAAREVFVGTMATIYSVGNTDDEATIREKMAAEKDPVTLKPRYDVATSFSLLIFYVFAMQCMSTLAVTRRETKSWKWPVIQFVYMGIMAYVGSLVVYQVLAG